MDRGARREGRIGRHRSAGACQLTLAMLVLKIPSVSNGVFNCNVLMSNELRLLAVAKLQRSNSWADESSPHI